MAYNIDRVVDICKCTFQLQAFLRVHEVLICFNGDCCRCANGRINLRQDKSVSDGQIWRCSNKRCHTKFPVRKYSFFSGSHLSLAQITKLIYYWTYQYPIEIAVHETNVTNKTVIDFYNSCRDVCIVLLEKHSEKIGGPGKIVEIDESKLGKRKCNREKGVEGMWLFGGIERNSEPPKCFLVTVSDRTAATLIPIIKGWILPGTKIVSDCWKSYHCLESEGYIHESVNHSVEFVTETAVHTNYIKSRWNVVKKSLPRYGTESYFAEYCIRRKYLDFATDKFLHFLHLISLVYLRLPSCDEELLATMHEDSSSAVASASTTFAATDVGNFDVKVKVDPDEDMADDSGGFFM